MSWASVLGRSRMDGKVKIKLTGLTWQRINLTGCIEALKGDSVCVGGMTRHDNVQNLSRFGRQKGYSQTSWMERESSLHYSVFLHWSQIEERLSKPQCDHLFLPSTHIHTFRGFQWHTWARELGRMLQNPSRVYSSDR